MIRKILTILTILSATSSTNLQSKYATSSQNYHRHDGSLSYNYAVVHETKPRVEASNAYHQPIQYTVKSNRNEPKKIQRQKHRLIETKRLKITSQKPVALKLYLEPRLIESERRQYQQYTTVHTTNASPLPKNQPLENVKLKAEDVKNNQVSVTNYVYNPNVKQEFLTPQHLKHNKPSSTDHNQYALSFLPHYNNKEQPKSLQEHNDDFEKTHALYQQVPRLHLNVTRSYIANTPQKAPPAVSNNNSLYI